jgi:TolB-like protein/class 3 adenylate cyclase
MSFYGEPTGSGRHPNRYRRDALTRRWQDCANNGHCQTAWRAGQSSQSHLSCGRVGLPWPVFLWYSATYAGRTMAETRKLAAILAADVVGFSRMIGADEDGTLARLRTLRSVLIDPSFSANNGRVFKRTGDGVLVEFRSVVAAVRCALDVQKAMIARNAGEPDERRIEFRIGVHMGDVVEESDGDLMGDGVNIAARLEGIAEPGGVCLSSTAYEQVRDKLQETFVDLGEQSLKNIARALRVYAFKSEGGPGPAARVAKSGLASRPKLSIVVLPFANFGGDPEQDHFVDGVTESLTTDLSRIRGSFVIARNTAFSYKGKRFDVKTIGRELNVRYALEGSIQRSSGRMRINVQLIDAESGNHLWAERFDKPVADLFDMQDEIVARLADQIGAHLVVAEARRAERSANPDSMDLYFQGRVCLNKSMSPESLDSARGYFERALALDPDNLLAIHGVTLSDIFAVITLVVDDRAARLAAAETKLTRLLLAEPDNGRFHFTLGLLLVYTNRLLQGIAEYERALALDPNLAGVHAQIGSAKIGLGRPQETEGHVLEALRLSPRDTAAYGWAQIAGNGKLYLGQNEQAIAWYRRSIEINGGYAIARFFLCAALAELGRLDEARREVQVGLGFSPQFTIRRYRNNTMTQSDPDVADRREQIMVWMLRAGVPEY